MSFPKGKYNPGLHRVEENVNQKTRPEDRPENGEGIK